MQSTIERAGDGGCGRLIEDKSVDGTLIGLGEDRDRIVKGGNRDCADDCGEDEREVV